MNMRELDKIKRSCHHSRPFVLSAKQLFLYLWCYWEEKYPEQKGSSSIRENLDNFQRADGHSGLICLDVITSVEHIGRDMSIARRPVQRLSYDRQIPAFLITTTRRIRNLTAQQLKGQWTRFILKNVLNSIKKRRTMNHQKPLFSM